MPLPCLKPRRSSKVCPAPNSSLDVDLVEVRKGRMLRIQHINPRLRNKQVPQTKHGKTQAPLLELHVPRVSFYGNKFVVTDAPTSNSNHVKNAGSGLSPNNNRALAHVTGQNSNGGRCVKSNSFPSNLSKEQKRMLFKMGVRSVSALKNIVLFFFHGVGGSSDIWQTQINYFSSLGFEIVAPDLIGHGMSEVPLKKRAYHFREILSDVIAVFDRYCKKKNLVIGHSYGCAFTTVLARERARRVWRLILISGGGPIPLAPEIGIFAFPLWFVSCIRPCLDQVFEKSAFKKKQKNEMLKRASFNIPSFVLHHVINGQDWPEGDEVYHSWISVPTLLINGRDDTFATLDDAKLMKATIHGSKLEIVDDSSHMVMLEAPDKVNKLILDFICSRGSHKLPDVKESAEEGQESPLKATTACSYGSRGGGMAIHPLHQHQHNLYPHHLHQHNLHNHQRAHEDRPRTPTQSPRSNVIVDWPETVPSPQPSVTIPDESRECTEEDEVDSYTPKRYEEETPAQGNSTPWRKLSKHQQGSSYDNASYESDESGEEYYYYKDQYGNHHYISATEYARQFPHNQQLPDDYRANEIEMEMSTVDIPAFEDISVDRSTETDGNTTEGESTPDYSSPQSYPVEINATHPNDLNTDGSPGYMASRKTHLSDHKFESLEMAEVCESPCRSRERYAKEIDENLPPRFSVPELQFCEACIQKEDSAEKTTDCEKCININMTAAGYRNHQNSCTRRQSVTLALGRQRSDSLDYLGQEQLIIITCYDKTEEEEISISSSTAEDACNGIWRLSKEQQSNPRVTRHGQRTGGQEADEATCKKPTLPTLDEREEEYSPRASPVVGVRGCRRNEDLMRSVHMELLAKVKKRNSVGEERKSPKVGKNKTVINPSLASEPSSDEGVVCRSSSFLESKKLMEAHFSKTAFKMQARCLLPALPSSGRNSPSERPPERGRPKVLGPKPEHLYHSPIQITREQPEECVVGSSPSFLQSKQAIHEHFSKICLNSPMSRPFSSPNLVSYGDGANIHAISSQRERKLSNSSPSALTKPLNRPEEALASDPYQPDEESPISLRLSISEWAEKHLKRVSESVSPEKSKVSVETPESASASSSRSASGSSSPVSTSLNVRERTERHLKRIAESISPTCSPYNATSKENVSPKCSPGKHEIVDEEAESRNPLSLNDWADRHLKLVASRLSSSPTVSEQSEDEARTSSEKEDSIPKAADSLTISDWAQKVAEMKTAAQNESGIVVPKSTKTSENGAVKKEVGCSQEPETKALSLNEWAERHVRKIAEINSRSPKGLQVKLSDAESSPVCEYGSVRTPNRVAKPVGKISTNALIEWAEKHIRRISEQKLVAGPAKEENGTEQENNNKKEGKTATNVSAIGQGFETSTVQSDQSNSLTSSQSEDQSLDREEKAPEANKNNTSAIANDTSEEKKTENNRGLNIFTSGEPQITQSLSNKPSFSRLPELQVPVSGIDSDLRFESCHEKLIDSPISEERSRPVRQRRRSSSSQPQEQVPQGHRQDNKNPDFLTNSVANNNNNNNNADLQQAFSGIPATRPTFDNNSNVVASTSVSREDKDSSDTDPASHEEQQSCCHQSADKTVPIDNDNNRIKSHSTSVTTTDTDTPILSNVSNPIAYTTTTVTMI